MSQFPTGIVWGSNTDQIQGSVKFDFSVNGDKVAFTVTMFDGTTDNGTVTGRQSGLLDYLTGTGEASIALTSATMQLGGTLKATFFQDKGAPFSIMGFRGSFVYPGRWNCIYDQLPVGFLEGPPWGTHQ